jgi:hypothetical protein
MASVVFMLWLVLMGCASIQPIEPSVPSEAKDCLPLSAGDVTSLREVARYRPDDASVGPAVAVGMVSDTTAIIAYRSGLVVAWDWLAGSVAPLYRIDRGPVLADMDPRAHWLALLATRKRAKPLPYREYETHMVVLELPEGRVANDRMWGWPVDVASISPNGEWLVDAEQAGFMGLTDLARGGGRGYSIKDGDRRPEFTALAFDPASEFWAYAAKGDGIRLEPVYYGPSGRSPYWVGVGGTQNTLAMAFDPARQHIAVLWESRVEVRSLQGLFYPVRSSSDLNSSSRGVLEFDPSGSLLAMGTDGGWQLRKARDLRSVLYESGEPADSLAFSPSGCYLCVGQRDGTVSLWGALHE